MDEKIRYKDLSTPLKFAVVGGWIPVITWGFVLLAWILVLVLYLFE